MAPKLSPQIPGWRQITSFRDMLVDWYHKQRRSLPWRETTDPYAIWVSEVMLQQTRVETVIPYFERFMDAFPTPEALASASEDAVLSRWSGLGYYRRARLLHAGAKAVVADHGGKVPADATLRRALPGVGRYTAGAIGSIAFGKPEAIVDGNVARVLCRVHGIRSALGERQTESALWGHSEALMAAEARRGDADPGSLNQALMELGALVCGKGTPHCLTCPVRTHCEAYRQGVTDALPVPKKRKAPKPVAHCAVCARDEQGRLWLVQSQGSLFSGLWGPPMVPGVDEADAWKALQQAGLRADTLTKLGTVQHTLTHRQYAVTVFGADAAALDPAGADAPACPFGPNDLSEVGLSRLARKILACETPPSDDKA